MNYIPIVIEQDNGYEKSYDIYSRLLKERIIFISGEINDAMSNSIIAQLLLLDSQNHNDIYLYINSPGGSVTSGLAIYDTMNHIKSDINTICFGLAASMGAFLLAAGTKGKRFILPNADVMIHQILGKSEGQASDKKIDTNRIIQLKKRCKKKKTKSTGKSIKKIEQDTDRDYYLTATEAIEYGLVDKLAN